jgi:hypothetical protein
MHVLQVVVQRKQNLQVLGCNGLRVFAWLEHVHAGFGESEVRFDAFGVAVEEFGGCAEKENYGGCEGPVNTAFVSLLVVTFFLTYLHDPAALGQCAIEREQSQYASDVLGRNRALLTVHPDIVRWDVVQCRCGAVCELGFSRSDEQLSVQ